MNGYVNSTEFANLLEIMSGGICHMLDNDDLPAPDLVKTSAKKTLRYWKPERAKVFATLYYARLHKTRFIVAIPDSLCRKLDKICKILGQTRDEVIVGSIKAITS